MIKGFLKSFHEVNRKDKCLINIKPAVKIFGSIFGQYDLLLKIF